MEQWEIDLRAQLENEVLEGAYDISCDGWHLYTGKQGKINQMVEVERLIRRIIDLAQSYGMPPVSPDPSL